MASPEQIYQTAVQLRSKHGAEAVPASDYGLKPADEPVYYKLDLPDKKHRQINLNLTTDFAHRSALPFEWKLEITFYDPDSHYLWLTDGRFVRAVKREFFDVTPEELTKISAALNNYLL